MGAIKWFKHEQNDVSLKNMPMHASVCIDFFFLIQTNENVGCSFLQAWRLVEASETQIKLSNQSVVLKN